MPFFTIVIPTYNRAEKLVITIRSVIEQTFEDFELLVMDDGSTDDTEKMINAFSDPRIRYEWAPNSGGPATPRNRGINAAKSPWISFLDADDVWYPTKLSEVAQTIINNPEVHVLCHNEMLNVIGSNKKTLLKYGPYEKYFYRIMLTQGNRLSTSAVTVRTDFLRTHDLRFNQNDNYIIVEDYDFWLYLASYKAQFVFINKPLGEYIVENDNISLLTKKLRHNEKVILKNHVYNVQQFEIDKDKLWSQICLRLDIKEGRELFGKGEIIKGLSILLRAMFTKPIQLYKYFHNKIQYKL